MRPEQADRHSDTVEASRMPPTTRTTCRAAAGPRSLTLPAVRIGLPSDDSDARGMPPDAVHVERLENPQVTNPICARICARDAAGRIEKGEMPTLDTDAAAPVDRGQRDEWRQSERPETNVVWLITQRSRVQIPPPLPTKGQRPFLEQRKGLLHVVCKLICKPRARSRCLAGRPSDLE